MTTEHLREQIARAVKGGDYPLGRCDCAECMGGVADAVLPVVEAEVERRTAALTAERDALITRLDAALAAAAPKEDTDE